MKKVLLMRIPASASFVEPNTIIVQWGKYTAAGSLIGDIHLTSIDHLREAWLADEPDGEEEECLPDEVVLILGGTRCFYRHLTINSGQKKHLATALPYLVEEHLAQDIETMHIVNGLPDKDLQVSVAAISHLTLQALLALFDEQRLSLTSIVAEMQFLETEPEYTTLLLDNGAAMMASPGHEGITLNDAALPLLFPNHFDPCDQELPDTLECSLETTVSEGAAGQPPSRVKLMFSDNTLAVSTSRIDEVAAMLSARGWQVDKRPLRGSVFEFFAEYYFAVRSRHRLIDFRQGAYQCPGKSARVIRRWGPLLAAAGCWLILELGLSVAEGVTYQKKAESLWQDSIKSYLSVFPGDRQAQQAQIKKQMSFNVRQIMEHRFRSLDAKTSETPFLPMLQALSSAAGAMGEEANFEPRNLDFNDTSGQLVYEFSAGELATVNRFLEKLNALGLQGKLDSANQGTTGVIARITLKM